MILIPLTLAVFEKFHWNQGTTYISTGVS